MVPEVRILGGEIHTCQKGLLWLLLRQLPGSHSSVISEQG